MPQVIFRNKIGTKEALGATAGQTVAEVLQASGIPVNAVITRQNGVLIAEEAAVISADDEIEILQVRHYDLNVTRQPRRRISGVRNPVYTKAVLFDENGVLECRCERFDNDTFVRYVEEVFVQSVQLADLIRPGDNLVVGLSGGRDSVAFLKLIERTSARLPSFSMTAVTVTGLPDWEEPATLQAARAICADLNIEQIVVGVEEISNVFRLERPFAEVMDHVAADEWRSLGMVVGHQVLRRMLETVATRLGVSGVIFGFNADDLVASLITWFTSGFRMGGIPVRTLGSMRYLFPLYRVTKKELTLYLEILAPELSRQGPPGRFTTGSDERSMAYAVSDWLYDLWPGIDYYVFGSFENTQRYSFPLVEQVCASCGGVCVLQEGVENQPNYCDVCALLMRHGFAALRE
jgi:tRNA(Ile)-lysidine synthase TilS/MesJ/sulfur carrier protein ThiS